MAVVVKQDWSLFNWSFTEFCAFTVFLICLKFWIFNTSKSKKIPPGPWGLPLIGNIFRLGNEPWKKCLEWKNFYGPIVTVKIVNLNAVVLTDSKLIREAFALPAFSGRPKIKIFDRPNGEGLGPVHGPTQIEQRQFTMKQLKNLVLHQNEKMENSIKDEVDLVIKAIEEESKNNNNCPIQIHHRFSIPTFSSIWSVFMGYPVDHSDVRVLKMLKLLQENASLDGILSKLSFFVPTLSTLFPEATGYKKWKRDSNEIYDGLEKEIKELPPSYTPGQPTNYIEAYADMIKMNEENPNSSFYPAKRIFPYTVFDLIAAAVETTGTSLEWACIALVKNPPVQNRIFQEIHSVCGENVPSLLDRGNCPYTEAVVYELLRRHNVFPFGIPHSAIEEVPDFFGYTIKKDTIVLPNFYGIHMDPEVWGDPQNFRPERFLENESIANKRALLAFSTGRRSCLGDSIAKDQLFLFISTIVQKFHIQPDPKNPPTLEALSSIVCAPKPVKLLFVKR